MGKNYFISCLKSFRICSMTIKTFCLCFCFLLVNQLQSSAQVFHNASIINDKDQPIEYAYLVVTNQDNYVFSNSMTDSLGQFKLKIPTSNMENYHLNISCFSYQNQKIPLKEAVRMNTYQLKQLSETLEEVNITTI